MGETTQALIAALRADVSGFRRDLNQAVQASQQFGRETSQQFDTANRSGRRLDNNTRQLSQTFTQLRNVILTLGLGAVAREGFVLASQFIAVERTLSATTGSVQNAADAYQFIRQESLRLGQDIISGARAFSQMTENVRGTALAGDGVRVIFSALGETVAALGLSTDQYQRALIATNQTLARGRVSTEELNQFAEAGIPLFRSFAETLNLTGDEFRKALEQGLVPADTLLLVMADLRDRFGEVAEQAAQTTPLAFSRLRSVLSESTAQFFQAILASDGLNRFLNELTSTVSAFASQLNTTDIRGFTDDMIRLFQAVTRFGSTVISFFTDLRNSIPQIANVRPFLESLASGVTTQLQALGLSQQAAESASRLIFGLVDEQSTAAENLRGHLQDVTTVLNDLSGYDQDIDDLNQSFADLEDSVGGFVAEAAEGTEKAVAAAAEAGKKIKEELDNIGSAQSSRSALRRQVAEIARAAQEAERERLKGLERFIEIREQAEDEANRRELRNFEAHLSQLSIAEIEMLQRTHDLRIELADIAEETITKRRFDAIVRRAELEQNAAEDAVQRAEDDAKKAAEEAARPFQRAADNIQDALADSIVSVFEGEGLDSAKDFFDSIGDIARRTGAEILAALIQEPLKDAVGEISAAFSGAGQQAAAAGGQDAASGAAGAAGAAGEAGVPGAGGASAFSISQAIGAAGLGIGVGTTATNLLSQFGLGGPGGSALGGALGGAAAGTVILPGFGTLVGAGVGGLLGGLAGIFGGGGPRASRFAVQTTAGLPGVRPSDDAFIQGAFGTVSLIDAESKRANAAQISSIVAELDRNIFNATTERQRQLIEAQLQAPVNNAILGEGDFETDEALRQVVNQRLSLIIEAIGGAQVAERVVGSQGPDADINALQRRVEDALGIFRLIEEIESGPTTQAAETIRNIEEEFAIAISRAEEFGIETATLARGMRERIAEVANEINRDIQQRLRVFNNPFEARRQALLEQQRLELENARDANANIEALLEVQRRERLALQQEIQDARRAFNFNIQQRQRFLTNPDEAQRQALLEQQRLEIEAAREVGGNVQALLDVQRQERQAFERELAASARAIENSTASITGRVTDFVQSISDVSQERRQIDQLTETFQELRRALREEGGSTAELDQAFRDARRRIFVTAQDRARAEIEALTRPFDAARRAVEEQLAEFAQLVEDRILPPALFNRLERVARAANVVDEAIAIAGGTSSPIEQFADTIAEFVRRGNPLSQAGEQFRNLTQEFTALFEATELIGGSTRALERSYQAQAQVIRDELVAEIDNQLASRRGGVDSITDLLNSFRVSEQLPGNLRFQAARDQFREAFQGGDIQEILGAAQQLREQALQRFGTTAGFFATQTHIEQALLGLRDREQAAIEAERTRLIEQRDRELQQIAIGRDSLTALQLVGNRQDQTNQGLAILIREARMANVRSAELTDVLERTLARLAPGD